MPYRQLWESYEWEEDEEEEDSGGSGDDSGDSGDEGSYDDSDDSYEDSGDSGGDDQWGGSSGGGDWEASGDWGSGDYDDSSGDSGYDDYDDGGWAGVQDYEEDGRTIRKYTDWDGTDYFQDIGAWDGGGDEGRSDLDYERDRSWEPDTSGDDWVRQWERENPDLIQLHQFHNPHYLTDRDDDPVRLRINEGIASDGMRFDQQPDQVRAMFETTYGERAAPAWAEERTRSIMADLQAGRPFTQPAPEAQPYAQPAPEAQPPVPVFRPSPEVSAQELQDARATEEATRQYEATQAPPSPESPPPPATPAEAPPPPAAPSAAQPATPAQQNAAQIAAQAAAAAGGSPDQVARAAVAAALALEGNRSLRGEAPGTQQAFRSAFGPDAESEWQRQHREELARNYALYGSAEPRAGAPQTGTIPGLGPGAAGPAPDRSLTRPGGAQPAPWNVYRPPAASVPSATGAQVEAGIQQQTATASSIIGNLVHPSGAPAAPPVRDDWRTAGAASSVLFRPTAPPARDDWPVNPSPPSAGEPGGPPLAPGPVLGDEATDATNRAVAAGPVTEQRVPPVEALPGSPEDHGFTRTSNPDAPVTIQNAYGETRTVPTWAYEQMGEQAREVWRPVPTAATYAPNDPQFAEANGVNEAVRVAAGIEPPSRGNIPPTVPVPGMVEPPSRGNIPPTTPTPTMIEPPSRGNIPPTPPARYDPAALLARPLDTVAEVAAAQQGATDVEGFKRNVASGVVGYMAGRPEAAWAEPYVNDIARAAYAREAGALPQQATDDYIRAWKDAFKGGDHRVPMVEEVDQQLLDRGARLTRPGAAFNWKETFGPTGERGLISRQVTGIDCGPNAFANILRSQGYNADPADAFPFARQHAYHDGSQFTGPANFARMLRDEAGLDAQARPLDWNVVDRELSEGRLVTLSSPGHYWTISAKDARGRYYAGATADVVGNAKKTGPDAGWVVGRGGFSYGGAPNTMITYTGSVDPNSRAVREMSLKPPDIAPAAPTARTLQATEPAPPGGMKITTDPDEPDDFGSYVRWSAARKGIDPDQVAAVMGKEGPEGWGSVGRFDSGTSYGPLQLHYAGGPRPQAGMGDDFTQETGIDLRKDTSIYAHKRAVDYALDRLLKKGDYREWYGADKAFAGGKGRFTPVKRIAPTGRQAEAPSGDLLMLRQSTEPEDRPSEAGPSRGQEQMEQWLANPANREDRYEYWSTHPLPEPRLPGEGIQPTPMVPEEFATLTPEEMDAIRVPPSGYRWQQDPDTGEWEIVRLDSRSRTRKAAR